MHIDGQCHCGFVTYEAEIDPEDVSICHCTDCQRLTGSAYRVSVSAPRASFRLTGGEPKLYVKIAENSRKRLQFFCPQCGSPIYTTGTEEDAEEIGIRVGTINQRAELTPRSQIWCSSALPWVGDISELPGRPRE
ncbi:GFA family protein [Sinorhizobium americanum]|uniref:Glutathione-dependent formaldehyde-activating protein n=1 Tax=Sinorhizobium americanum TaxID=194963 RepID=A0A1L3LHX2_9HYPH|nr:GFA family protein [Sinorhizobium americanum]APG89687.1 glutathione-dependent formaldehyde-activating protein [Sinorhizobium americanum]OAP36003.1 aldehyde-activating protein [Sinorhizobium americanum]